MCVAQKRSRLKALRERNDNTSWTNQQDRLWAYFQNSSPEAFEGAKSRLDFIIKQIGRKKVTDVPRVLNVGIGSGYLEEEIQRRGWDIYSLDPDEKTIRRLIKRGIKAKRGYIEQMPFDDASFDFVIASEVLEHLTDEKCRRGIQEVIRVLKSCGWFIGTVPYCEDLLLNQVVCPRCGETFHRWGHRKSFDIKIVHDELSTFFDEVVAKRTAFVTFRDKPFKGKIKSLVRLILAKYGEAIAAPSIYFAARKLR